MEGHVQVYTLLTTKMRPKSLTAVHLNVNLSFRYGGFLSVFVCVLERRSSMNMSEIRELTTLALTGRYVLDHSTTPEVEMISKQSSIVW